MHRDGVRGWGWGGGGVFISAYCTPIKLVPVGFVGTFDENNIKISH